MRHSNWSHFQKLAPDENSGFWPSIAPLVLYKKKVKGYLPTSVELQIKSERVVANIGGFIIILQWSAGKWRETGFFPMWTGFSSISSDWCVVWSRFFYRRKKLPEPNSIFGYDMRLKIVQMGHMGSEKNFPMGCLPRISSETCREVSQFFWMWNR